MDEKLKWAPERVPNIDDIAKTVVELREGLGDAALEALAEEGIKEAEAAAFEDAGNRDQATQRARGLLEQESKIPEPEHLLVRDVGEGDLAGLTQLKKPRAIHVDRLQDSQSGSFRYLVLEYSGQVVGFACLVFTRPSRWSDAHRTDRLPQIVDLQIAPAARGRGCGSYFIRSLEQLANLSGCRRLFLAVDPDRNPRAHALYQRLGYRPMQADPQLEHWEFVDSDGTLHQGDNSTVDMVKEW